MGDNSNNNVSIAFVIFIIGIIIALVYLFNENFFRFILIIAITGGISGIIWQYEQKKKEKKKVLAARQAVIEKLTPIYNSKKTKLITKYGEPDKTIILEDLNLSKEIIAFGKANRIWLLGKDLPMSDIINCTYNDGQYIEKGKFFYETTTSTGSMAKRAILGGVLLGCAGAVIGGVTAKKKTIVNQEDDTIIHDYTVIINVNSLSEPIVRIPLGNDSTKVNEIMGLMNVIINRGKH